VIGSLGAAEQEEVNRVLTRFTDRIETLIQSWLDQVLLIRQRIGMAPGLFDFRYSDEELRELMDGITVTTSFTEFVDRLMAFCWKKVDASLHDIREELDTVLLPGVNAATDSLISALELLHGHARGQQRLIDSVVRAKTNAQTDIATIREWFRRPSDLQRSPFDMDLAVRVALRQINQIFTDRPLSPTIEIDVPFRLQGDLLDGMVEVLYLLLQNAVLKSGFTESTTGVSIEVKQRAQLTGQSPDSNSLGEITLVVSNDLAPMANVAEQRALVNQAQLRYEHDSAMRLADREGGSGLSKVWRTLQFDLAASHKLTLNIDDDARFHATLEIGKLRIC